METAEDISFMTSPALHRRFVAPLHVALGRRFPYTIVHLHSAQLHTVPTLIELEGIAAIQVTPDFGEDTVPHVPQLARILERKRLLIHGVISVASALQLIRTLPSRGLGLFFRCETPAEAARVLNSFP